MRNILIITAALLLAGSGVCADGTVGEARLHNVLTDGEREAGFQLLFNGENLDGWKAAENPDSFVVRDGELVAGGGPRGHLFYVGPVNSAVFTNFHLKLDVMTEPGSNSGIYFHTAYQERGWPKQGYEAQVNNSGKDGHKTGVLYGTGANEPPVNDGQWFLYEIIVEGKHVQLKVNGVTTTTYTEPEDVNFPNWPGRRLSQGSFALQAHDPDSRARYRTIRVRPLPQE